MAAEASNPLKLAVTLAIDYVRWTQLSPLVTIWAFALAMLAVMLFVNNEEQGWDLVSSLTHWIAGLPLIGDSFAARMESLAGEDGSIHISGHEFKAVALKAWGFLSLVFMVLALAANRLLGPFKPWSLKRKLGTAALCCLAMTAGYAAVYFANPGLFNGPASQWMLTFGGISLVLFIVSAWCLSIAHVLGLARRAVETRHWGASAKPGPRYVSERR